MHPPVTRDAFTLADLEAMPDDGRRYELIGGSIVVMPPPTLTHQRCSRRLQRLIEVAAELRYEVFNAPIGLSLDTGDEVEPDLVVVEPSRTGKRLHQPLLLVVEIVSPGSARHDRVTKLDAYARAGVEHYWVVDPRDEHHEFMAFRLTSAGSYETVGRSETAIDVVEPLRVSTTIAALVDPQQPAAG